LVEQAVIDAMQVSHELAVRIRKLIFAYAAGQVRNDEVRFHDLLNYGGVK